MKKTISGLLVLLSFFLVQTLHAQQKNGLRYEIMLSRNMLNDSLKNACFSYNIDISPKRYIALSKGNDIYLLGWGGISQLGKNAMDSISTYAFTSDGLLMAVIENNLYYMDSTGAFVNRLKLPTLNMGLAAGKNVMFLFDQHRSDSLYKLYALAKGRKYKQLLVTPMPISSIVEMGDSVYFAMGSAVFSFSPNSLKLNLVAGMQKQNRIISLTADTVRNILYMSTGGSLFAKQGKTMVHVTDDFGGGILKYFGDGLVIFNPLTDNVIRIVNIDKSIKF
jgi:hypothetical protein